MQYDVTYVPGEVELNSVTKQQVTRDYLTIGSNTMQIAN